MQRTPGTGWLAADLGMLADRSHASPVRQAYGLREAARFAASTLPGSAVSDPFHLAADEAPAPHHPQAAGLRAVGTLWATVCQAWYDRTVPTLPRTPLDQLDLPAASLEDAAEAARSTLEGGATVRTVQVGVVLAVRRQLGTALPCLAVPLSSPSELADITDRARWTGGYLRAVGHECSLATERLTQLERDVETWTGSLPKGRSTNRLPDVLRSVLNEPFVTAGTVAERHGITRQAATTHLRTLVDGDVLRATSDRPKGRAYVLTDLSGPSWTADDAAPGEPMRLAVTVAADHDPARLGDLTADLDRAAARVGRFLTERSDEDAE